MVARPKAPAAVVLGVRHEVLGVVEVRPRGRGGPLVRPEHHPVAVGGLRVCQRRRHAPQVVFLIVIAVTCAATIISRT